MINISNISFEFGGRYLYKNADWHIKPKERIGLVGLNGTGKSTLLRLLNGEYLLESGVISKAKDLTIGFLNQDLLSYDSDRSILEVALEAFSRQLELERQIEELLVLAETDHSDAVMEKLGDCQMEFAALDGYTIHSKTEEILEGLGFSTADLKKPLKNFSGGWRMRVMLAKLLLQQPQLLMLDEPTNHLDLPSIEWLENYLLTYEGTVIIVSHDRYFLDRMVTKIVEVANQKLYSYSGNYEFFLKSKEERDELQQKQFDNQQAYIKQQERFIERFKAKASKATAAQSRVKLLEKLERVEEVKSDAAKINLRFKVSKASGKIVNELKNISKSYGDNVILKDASAQIVRHDKIALIGANGKGKSTLLRILAGAEKCEGERVEGYNVIDSFYAQHQLESLNVNSEILQELQNFAPTRTDMELRTVLGCFLFSGDDVFKKIKVLSGGEKARVALAKTLLGEANFLLLDEPTNHLDMQSIGILIEALKSYEGSFIVVSHDRFFVSEIANKIWWIEDQEIKEYPGTFAEYNEWNEKRQLNNAAPAEKKKGTPKEKSPKEQPPKNGNDQEIKKLKGTLEKFEIRIAELKRELAGIEKELSSNQDSNNIADLGKKHHQVEAELNSMNKQFEDTFEQLISLEG